MRLRTLALLVVGPIVGAVLSPVLAFEAWWRWRTRDFSLPDDWAAPGVADAPVADAVWLASGGAWPPALEPLWLGNLNRSVRDHSGQGPEGFAARMMVVRLPEERTLSWVASNMATTVWLTRHADAGHLKRWLAAHAWFGRGAYGTDDAARVYFGKPAFALTTAEAAFLGDQLNWPVERGCGTPRPRHSLTLGKMLRAGLLTEAEFRRAAHAPVEVLPIDCPPAPRYEPLDGLPSGS